MLFKVITINQTKGSRCKSFLSHGVKNTKKRKKF